MGHGEQRVWRRQEEWVRMGQKRKQELFKEGRQESWQEVFEEVVFQEEVAPAFVYFASEIDSSYVTGEVLTLLGGETTAA